MPFSDLPGTLRRLLRPLPLVLRNPRYLVSGRVRRRMRHEAVLQVEGSGERFARIYESRAWRGSESVSGAGSSLEATREIRTRLPALVARHGVGHLLDAPCGDFFWMKAVVRELPALRYTGGDIVERLVLDNRRRHGGERIRFEHLDITADPLPAADLMMVRDCLFHLSYADAGRFLVNLARAEIALLLTTSNVIEGETIENRDIASGGFRPVDLFTAPFGFPRECLESFDDNDVSVVGKRMYLFRVEALIEHLAVHSPLYRAAEALDSTS